MVTKTKKSEIRKITVNVPAAVLELAMKANGEGLTATVVEGLQKVAAKEAYARLLAARGTYKSKMDFAALRD
jgi:hypothetical protein